MSGADLRNQLDSTPAESGLTLRILITALQAATSNSSSFLLEVCAILAIGHSEVTCPNF